MSLYECYVDGASRGQGVEGPFGHGAAAVLIYKNKTLIGQYARALGRRTNNEAEYEAVLLALVMCWSSGLENPVIYSDSALVVNQVNGTWNCKHEDLLPLLHSIKEIQDVYRFRITQVPRSYVAEADQLANDLLDNLLEPRPERKPRKKKRKKKTPPPEGGGEGEPESGR